MADYYDYDSGSDSDSGSMVYDYEQRKWVLRNKKRRAAGGGRVHKHRIDFHTADGRHVEFTARVVKRGIKAAPARLRPYARATQKIGFVPKRGTPAYRSWLAAARTNGGKPRSSRPKMTYLNTTARPKGRHIRF